MKVHIFDVEDAKKYGITEATLLAYFKFWLNKNYESKKHFHKNTFWTYSTIKNLTNIFNYLTERQIIYALNKLKKLNVIQVDNFNINKFDKTNWFTITNYNFVISNIQFCNSDITNTAYHYTVKETVKEVKETNVSLGVFENKNCPVVANENKSLFSDNSNNTHAYPLTTIKNPIRKLISADNCPYDKLVGLYHEVLPTLPKVVALNNYRRGIIKGRWLEVKKAEKFDEVGGLEFFRRLFEKISTSQFLTGRVLRPDRKPFIATMEWIFRPNNFLKIMEGNYNG